MDFESPDVAKDFPGLYASESMKRSQSRDSDYSDEEKTSRKDLLGKKKEKRESKKDKGYVAFAGESSGEDEESRNPDKSKKNKSGFPFRGKDKKEKHSKTKEKPEKKEEKEKVCKKESKETKKDAKDVEKVKVKKKKESKLLKIKDKKKKSTPQEEKEEKPIFGVPLQVAVERSKSHDDIELPVIVRECIDYIEEHGLSCEGIYKISGLKSKVRNLKNLYNWGERVYLYEHEPHIVASLLKQFLRDLPEPILTSALVSKFEEAAAFKNEQKKVETLQKLLNELPNCNRVLLSWILVHIQHVIALERRNKMNLQNISIALSPAMQISHNILQALFSYGSILFKDVQLKKYVPPVELDSSRLSLELPDSPTAIAEELSKQENVLSILHAELNTGLRDQQKEEQLWEIQRVVTQLKRKLRFLRQIQDTSDSMSEVPVTIQVCETSHSVDSHQPAPLSTVLASKSNVPDQIQEKKENIPDTTEKACSEIVANETVPNKSFVKDRNSSEFKEKEIAVVDLKTSDKETVSSSTSDGFKDTPGSETTKVTKTADPILPNKSELKEAEDLSELVFEEKMLRTQSEELAILGDELRRKINSEKSEIERLKMEVCEYQQLYKFKRYSFGSTENSSSDSDDSSASDHDEDLSAVLEDLMRKNKQLEVKNKDISKVIQLEREACLTLKVQMKMLHTETPIMRL